MVLNKQKITQSTDELRHDPFLLNTETEQASSWFEIVFFIENVKYRYGFEADNTTIYAEWLFCVGSDSRTNRETRLFERDVDQNPPYVNQKFFKEGLGIKVPSNHLFIWKCDQNDGEISKAILKWFNDFNLIDGLHDERYISFALKQMEQDEFKTDLLKLVKVADLGIEHIDTEEKDIPKDLITKLPIPDELKQQMLDDDNLKSVELQTTHRKFDSNNQMVGSTLFELDTESKGTRKFFALSAPILDTLRHGKVLVIDELDASLHPKLTEYLVKLFNDTELNKHNAQLIFVTHDVYLLSAKNLFERDQIWFAEKDQYGSTNLYSLLEFKSKVRATEDKGKRYLLGHFGAVPYLDLGEWND
jgi:hypothetical protein